MNPQASSAREVSDAILARFLTSCPAAQLAAGSLRAGAEVGITFTDLSGDWCVRVAEGGGRLTLVPGKATDPDFELRISPGAVDSICARPDADLGDLGVAFFEHIKTRDPEQKIRVTLHSGLVKLTRRGWLTLLARGGKKVVAWMANKGLRGAGAIAGALARIRS
jgi:hypothetical protein